jgi:hypothetical protein
MTVKIRTKLLIVQKESQTCEPWYDFMFLVADIWKTANEIII